MIREKGLQILSVCKQMHFYMKYGQTSLSSLIQSFPIELKHCKIG